MTRADDLVARLRGLDKGRADLLLAVALGLEFQVEALAVDAGAGTQVLAHGLLLLFAGRSRRAAGHPCRPSPSPTWSSWSA